MTHSKANIFPQLPDSIDGWTAGKLQKFEDHESLYDYINGGAELYISYGYTSAISRRYSNAGQPEVTVEIFDMAKPENAFGVFSHTRYEEDTAFGQGSQYIEGALLFWKNNYFVSVMTDEETEQSGKLVFDLGRLISDSIEGEGNLPGIMDLLPSDSLDKAGTLYFHHYIWLNSYYFIADANILFIDDNTDAVLAKYGPSEERIYLLLVKYKDKAEAAKAYKSFIDNYFEGSDISVMLLEDQTWTTADLFCNTFIGIFNGKSEEAVNRLLSEVKSKIQQAADESNKIYNP